MKKRDAIPRSLGWTEAFAPPTMVKSSTHSPSSLTASHTWVCSTEDGGTGYKQEEGRRVTLQAPSLGVKVDRFVRGGLRLPVTLAL